MRRASNRLVRLLMTRRANKGSHRHATTIWVGRVTVTCAHVVALAALLTKQKPVCSQLSLAAASRSSPPGGRKPLSKTRSLNHRNTDVASNMAPWPETCASRQHSKPCLLAVCSSTHRRLFALPYCAILRGYGKRRSLAFPVAGVSIR